MLSYASVIFFAIFGSFAADVFSQARTPAITGHSISSFPQATLQPFLPRYGHDVGQQVSSAIPASLFQGEPCFLPLVFLFRPAAQFEVVFPGGFSFPTGMYVPVRPA